MSGWGSPSSGEITIGGRSPRAVDGREQDRTSRRLGLTHSLTSPRTPEPAKPELPARPDVQNTDDLPRPKSLSPRRSLAPPSVTGSALSAKLERASFVRASNAPPVPPPPKTRARFSAKRGELDDVCAGSGAADDGDAAATGVPATAPTPFAGVEEPLTPTPPKNGGRGGGESGSRVAALALAIESQRRQQQENPQDDETPVMTLPAVITAAQAAGLAAEKRMRDSRNHQQQQLQAQAVGEEPTPVGVGMGVKRVSRVRGRGAIASQREELVGLRSVAGSSAADIGATSVCGTGKSQIQSSESHEDYISTTTPIARNNSPFFNASDEYDEGDSPGPGFRRGPTSYNSPPTPRSSGTGSPSPPAPPAGPPPAGPCGTPTGFSANGIMRRSMRSSAKAIGARVDDDAAANALGREASLSPSWMTDGVESSGVNEGFVPPTTPPRLVAPTAAVSPHGVGSIPAYSSSAPIKPPPPPPPPPHHSKSPSSLPIPPPETPRDDGHRDGSDPATKAPPIFFPHETAEVAAASSPPPPAGGLQHGEASPSLNSVPASSPLASPLSGDADAAAAGRSVSPPPPPLSPTAPSAARAATPAKVDDQSSPSGALVGAAPSGLHEDDIPTPPPKMCSSRQLQQQQQQQQQRLASQRGNSFKAKAGGGTGAGSPTGRNEEAMESDLDFIRELTRYRGGAARAARNNEYEFALVLNPNDEYRDAVEVLELAFDLGEGTVAGPRAGGVMVSPQKLDRAKRVRESLGGLQKPPQPSSSDSSGPNDSPAGLSTSQSGQGSGRKGGGPPLVRPGLSEGLEGVGGGRRTRLRLLDDLQEEEGRLTSRRKKELERRKKHRLFHFIEKMKEGIIVRRHVAHRTCDQIVLQSTDDCKTISWKPLLAAEAGGGVAVSNIFQSLRGAAGGRLSKNRAETVNTAHIAIVLPAIDPDPSHPGFFGTRALRLSEDIPNPSRTFSLLYGDWGGAGVRPHIGMEKQVQGTLDLECADDGMYAMLFQGFLLLHMQTSHVVGGATASPRTTPLPAGLSTPPKVKDDDGSPGLDSLEAGSGARGGSGARPRPFSVRALSSSASSSAALAASSSTEAASGDGDDSNASPPSGGAGNRGSLRRSLRFLPDLLGGMSASSRLSRRNSQQACSQVMGGAPPEFFLGWTSPGTQIWSRMRMVGLEVDKLYHLDRRRVLLKIRLPRSKLEEVAEVMRLKVRRRDGTLGRFKKDHRSSFMEGTGGDLFRSSESQKVIDFIIRAKIKDGGSELDDRTELGKHICKRMPLHNQARLQALYDSWVVYWRAPSHQQVQQQEQQRRLNLRIRRRTGQIKTRVGSTVGGVPVPSAGGSGKGGGGGEDHGSDADEDKEWLTRSERLRERAEEAKEAAIAAARLAIVVLKGSMWQPLESIADYYGEATAFYFAWMGFYTQGLIIPSIFGLIVFGCQVHARTLDHPMMPIYAVFVILWSSALLVLWRQRCSELAYRWGVLHFEQEEQTRSQFWGKEQVDPVTGGFVREYPHWKRYATYAMTMPVMIGFTGGVLTLMFLILVRRDGSSAVDKGMGEPAFWGVMLIKPMLYGIMIPILYGLCKKLGVFLNNLENHKTENQYRNALIVKVFSFRFMTVFASLYHYAFISRDGSSNYKLLRLAASLCCFMTIGQWWYMICMCYIPGRLQDWQIGKLKAKVGAERKKLEKADADEAAGGGGGGAGEASRSVRRKLLEEAGDHLWEEALLKEYNMADVFDDYTMSLIQFGYVALFSAAFPLAPLLAMINNLVQTRVDAHKICKTRRRPIALKSGGIGVWDNVLEVMTVIAVITNCALIGVTSERWWPADVSPATRILVVVVAEHVILFLKYWLESSVPRVPLKVQRAQQRERVEREQKGGIVFAGSSGVGGDYAKFEANFSRALTTGDTADAVHAKSGGGIGSGAGIGGNPYSSTRTANLGGVPETTRALVVSDNLTVTTPTAAGGRARKGLSVNLGAFSTTSTVASPSPPPRDLGAKNGGDGDGGAGAGARRGDGGSPMTPRSASLSRAMVSTAQRPEDDCRGSNGSQISPYSSVPLAPPSAATARTCRYGGESEVSSQLSTSPPLPPKRFDWHGPDGKQM